MPFEPLLALSLLYPCLLGLSCFCWYSNLGVSIQTWWFAGTWDHLGDTSFEKLNGNRTRMCVAVASLNTQIMIKHFVHQGAGDLWAQIHLDLRSSPAWMGWAKLNLNVAWHSPLMLFEKSSPYGVSHRHRDSAGPKNAKHSMAPCGMQTHEGQQSLTPGLPFYVQYARLVHANEASKKTKWWCNACCVGLLRVIIGKLQNQPHTIGLGLAIELHVVGSKDSVLVGTQWKVGSLIWYALLWCPTT